MSDGNKIITNGELSDMWVKCFHNQTFDVRPNIRQDGAYMTGAQRVFYHSSTSDGFDPTKSGNLCLSYTKTQYANSGYADAEDALLEMFGHRLTATTVDTMFYRGAIMFDPLYSSTEDTNKLIKKDNLVYIPYERYTILYLFDFYQNMTININGAPADGDIYVSWGIDVPSSMGNENTSTLVQMTLPERSITSSTLVSCLCGFGIDENISNIPIELVIRFAGTQGVESIISAQVSSCYSKNVNFRDKTYAPQVHLQYNNIDKRDAHIRLRFNNTFNTLREILTSQLNVDLYVMTQKVDWDETIAINKNWYMLYDGGTLQPKLGQVGGLCLQPPGNAAIYLFDGIDDPGVYVQHDYTVNNISSQSSATTISISGTLLEEAMYELGYGSGVTENFYLKVPYYVKESSADDGSNYKTKCYLLLEVSYNPSKEQGSRWVVVPTSQAFIDVGWCDEDDSYGFFVSNSMGDLENHWKFTISPYGYGDGIYGLVTHRPYENIPHVNGIEVEATGDVDSREITCQFYSMYPQLNSGSVKNFWYERDEGGSTNFNFAAAGATLLNIVKSFNNTDGSKATFEITW